MILLAGDSLAVGVHPFLERAHVLRAEVGATSSRALRSIESSGAGVVIVSLGANDADDPRPFRVVVRRVLRGRRCVAWIAPPRRPRLRRVLRARARVDGRLHVVGLERLAQPDGVHPTAAGYRVLAARASAACPRYTGGGHVFYRRLRERAVSFAGPGGSGG